MLSGLGLASTIWGSALHCLEKLRNDHVRAVVVDRDFTQADILQFLLYVKEIDATVTVVVFGRPGEDQVDQALVNQTRAVFVDSGQEQEHVMKALKSALQNQDTEIG
jgi:DNA-binding NtrC family response regulator